MTNLFIGVIGKPRTGKTTYLINVAKNSKKKVYFFSPHNYEDYPTLNPNLMNKEKFLKKIYNLKNTLIILDDPLLFNFVDFKGTFFYKLAAYRGNNYNDVIIVSHGFRNLPPKIAGLFDKFILFKSGEIKIPEDKTPPILLERIKYYDFKLKRYVFDTVLNIYQNRLQQADFSKENLTYFKHYIYV